ncbi:MAG: hypothetical protein HY815_29290 [Candidatus Riflebacteria bacterium]|nr:hypothetical protein [Candidatus Riflebacteria bacterium]
MGNGVFLFYRASSWSPGSGGLPDPADVLGFDPPPLAGPGRRVSGSTLKLTLATAFTAALFLGALAGNSSMATTAGRVPSVSPGDLLLVDARAANGRLLFKEELVVDPTGHVVLPHGSTSGSLPLPR